MKSIKFAAIFFITLSFTLNGQQSLQTIRGTVIDVDSKTPLIGATVTILNSTPIRGSVTDVEGNFIIEKNEVGRVSLKISYVGYEEIVYSDLLLTAAKELVLEVAMSESLSNLQEVVVTVKEDKSTVLNEMSLVSGRKFSVEETQRYAGALSDPARMVSAFAGVTGNAEGNNDIVVRGNSPKGILWRLEGVEIPNPNHFANDGATGGPVNSLSSNMLSNSDFYSGAFSSDYGNALSGVFDIHYRKGNNRKHEFALGASVFGIEASAEGPFKKGDNSSYLFNYRYSSLQVLSDLGLLDFSGIPKYQDLSFNVSIPISSKNYLSVFGLGGISNISQLGEDDEGNTLFKTKMGTKLGVLGISNSHNINQSMYLKSTISIAATSLRFNDQLPTSQSTFWEVSNVDRTDQYLRLSNVLSKKFSARDKLESGVILSFIGFGGQSRTWDFDTEKMNTVFEDDGSTYTLQAFSNWKHRFNEEVTMTSGVHYFHFGLNNSYSIEPRLGLLWNLDARKSLNFGAGLHSKMESMSIYLSELEGEQLNEELGLSKSLHLITGYGQKLGDQTKLSVEAYYQYLFDIPIDNENAFSMINSTDSYYFQPLVNEGNGENYGLEMTLERYFDKGFYYMTTVSLYESTYIAADGVKRRTAFSGNYVANFLGGKEWEYGKAGKSKVFFINTKASLIGGSRYTPIDLQSSIELGEEVRFEDQPFSKKGDDVFFVNLAFGLRKDRKKSSSEFKIDISNITNNQAIVNEYYVQATEEIEQSFQLPFLPNIVYTFKF